MRYLTLFFITTVFLFAQKIHFTETKYVNALDLEVKKSGVIEIQGDNISLQYTNESKIIEYTPTHINIKDKEEISYLHSQKPSYVMFFQLIQGIQSDSTKELNRQFSVDKKQSITLIPKDERIKSVVEKIEYKKNKSQLEFVKIYFNNQDTITIHEKI